MDHIDEHILELYSLGSQKVEARRGEIEHHLSQCAGCRRLVDEMVEFYGAVEAEGNERRRLEESGQEALVPLRRQERGVVPRERGVTSRRGAAPPGYRMRSFIHRHPVVFGTGSFAFGAAVAAELVLFFSGTGSDTNPAYVFLNTEQNLVEIRNREHKKLWDFPSPALGEQSVSEVKRRVRTTQVADLDGDGRNEVLTVALMGNERMAGALRVFDAKQHLLFSRDFLQPFQYRDRSYTPRFLPGALLALPAGEKPGSEVFVVAGHEGHSPTYIARFDGQGRELGKYWHFGYIKGIYPIDAETGTQRKLLILGQNDTGDTSGTDTRTSYPFVAVLDPGLMVGQGKSAAAPGFVMGESAAEVYYIQFPNSSLDSALSQHMTAVAYSLLGDSTMAVNVESAEQYEGTFRLELQYRFDNQFRVLDVKTTDKSLILAGRLRQAGKFSGNIDEAYLTRLKNSVRYWDGRRWSAEPVRVDHSPVVSEAR